MFRRYAVAIALGLSWVASARADDSSAASPKNPQAQHAISKHEKTVTAAAATCFGAIIAADKQELTELDSALAAATQDGDLDRANATKAVRDTVVDDLKTQNDLLKEGGPLPEDSEDDSVGQGQQHEAPPGTPRTRRATSQRDATVDKARQVYWKAEMDADDQEAADLSNAMKAAVRNGDLEDGERIRAIRNTVLDDAKAVRDQHPRELINDMQGDIATFHQGMYILTEGNRVGTREKFAPPVAFHIIARTNSTDIRLAYAANQIIFNWARDRGQLRMDGGPADGRNAGGAGSVPINAWVAIDLVVKPDSMTISVDGEQRFHTEADFSKIDEPLAIFQGEHSIVSVKSIEVLVPK